MPDITAVEIGATDVSAELTTSLACDVRRLVSGALFTAALAAAGTVLFTLALMLAVVGSPLLAAGLVYVIVRRERADRTRAGPVMAD